MAGSETFSTTAGMTHSTSHHGTPREGGWEAGRQACEKARPEVLSGGEEHVEGEEKVPRLQFQEVRMQRGGRSRRVEETRHSACLAPHQALATDKRLSCLPRVPSPLGEEVTPEGTDQSSALLRWKAVNQSFYCKCLAWGRLGRRVLAWGREGGTFYGALARGAAAFGWFQKHTEDTVQTPP